MRGKSTHERWSGGPILRFENVADADRLQHACPHAALKAVIVDDENVHGLLDVVHARQLRVDQPVRADRRCVSPSTRRTAVSVTCHAPNAQLPPASRPRLRAHRHRTFAQRLDPMRARATPSGCSSRNASRSKLMSSSWARQDSPVRPVSVAGPGLGPTWSAAELASLGDVRSGGRLELHLRSLSSIGFVSTSFIPAAWHSSAASRECSR